jgi:hypothetical protein
LELPDDLISREYRAPLSEVFLRQLQLVHPHRKRARTVFAYQIYDLRRMLAIVISYDRCQRGGEQKICLA